jgi:hypothetical protein
MRGKGVKTSVGYSTGATVVEVYKIDSYMFTYMFIYTFIYIDNLRLNCIFYVDDGYINTYILYKYQHTCLCLACLCCIVYDLKLILRLCEKILQVPALKN